MDFIQRLTGTFLFALCTFSSISAAERPLSSRNNLRFDPGPIDSAIENWAVELNLDSVYTPKVGFGWTESPRQAFVRPELSRSRNALTIDGVSGNQLAFRADVATGEWYLTLWLETGGPDAGSPKVIIQGQERLLRWQVFRPPAEPRRSPQKVYRVFHGTTTVGSEGLSLELVGSQADVRLLGLSLIRRVHATKPEHRQLLQQVELAGRYQNTKSLGGLSRQADESLRKNSTDAFYAIWRLRLDQLATAQRYYWMRGWERANQKTGLGMFDRQYQAVMLLDGVLMPDPADVNRLTERALYLRGRLLYWLGKERGGVDEIAGAKRDLEKLALNHPRDDLLAMYTGKRIDLPDACDCLEPATNAPAWSIAQREALCRLRHIAHWWVEQRQADNGEFGGKLGDDVELLRWWAPLCLSGDKTALRGWKKLADGVWQSKHLFEGYARKMADVEHASEFVADTAPLMVIYSDDPQYEQRLAYSTKHFQSLWTGMTTHGHRFFRSAWFSSTAVDTDEPKGRDLEYNTRAVRAMRYLAWRRPDPQLVKLLHQWSTAWVHAAMRTDKGKPKGIIPASVRFADEAFNGDGSNWYQANMLWDYYEWEQWAGSLMLDQLLFTYTLTGDEQLLQPMFMALDLIRSEASSSSQGKLGSLQEGSPTWAAAKLVRCKMFWNVVEQWRSLDGDPRWDDLIVHHGTEYGRYLVSGNESHLVEGLNLLLDAVRYNTPLMTTEVIYTDRVYVPGAEHLKAMLTGDGIQENLSPYYSVSWEQTDEDFTALVSETGRDRLQVQLFSHAPEDAQIMMRLWQLAPGTYRLRSEDQGISRQDRSITVQDRGQRVPIALPSRRLLSVCLERVP